jgi:hypothetical protein
MIDGPYPFLRQVYDSERDETFYTFYSRGKRDILKVIAFRPIEKDGNKYYNWGFGDLVKNKTGGFVVDDKTESNNGDVRRVLYTVVSTLSAFFEINPEATVSIEGSNRQRMSIYEKFVARRWKDIEALYDVKGFRNGQIEPFQEAMDFDYLLISKKKP